MARSAGDLSGCLTFGMGPEGGGSSAIGNGVMNLISPFGGPVSSAMVPFASFLYGFPYHWVVKLHKCGDSMSTSGFVYTYKRQDVVGRFFFRKV